MSTIEERVMKTIAQQLRLDVSEIRPDSDFVKDLGADSLDDVEIVMAIEEEFKIDIADEDAEKWHTPADVIAYLAATSDITVTL